MLLIEHFKRGFLIKNVRHVPGRRGRSGLNSLWRREFCKFSFRHDEIPPLILESAHG